MPTKPAAKKTAPAKKTVAKKTAAKKTAAKKASPKKPAAKKAASAKAKATPARRTAAKVSPLKGMPVADWLKQKVTGWQAEAIQKLMDIAEKAAPGMTSSIKWSQPVLESNGPFAFIKPAKAHVTFGFWRGAEIKDASGVLEGGDRMKHIKYTAIAQIDAKHLTGLIKQAVEHNRTKGDPTKR